MGLPAVITGKCCTYCGVWKTFSGFHRSTANRDGIKSYCKTCGKIQAGIWYRRNSERILENKKLHREKHREDRLRRMYGITGQEYDQMLAEQNGYCLLCLKPFTHTPYVDHCHCTGRVRGLLCRLCNRDLSSADKDPAWLDRAKEYLSAA